MQDRHGPYKCEFCQEAMGTPYTFRFDDKLHLGHKHCLGPLERKLREEKLAREAKVLTDEERDEIMRADLSLVISSIKEYTMLDADRLDRMWHNLRAAFITGERENARLRQLLDEHGIQH